MYDVVIVGAGITGCAVAYELSKYEVSVCVLEMSNDVANGATKANSAILHAGFDCMPGTKAAKLNVSGAALAKEICSKLDVERRELPSLVLAFNRQEISTLEDLLERGRKNGVQDMRILDSRELHTLEPNVSSEAIAALYAPAAIVNPWDMAIAMAETAVKNGVVFKLSHRVLAIEKNSDIFTLETDKGAVQARFVVNAAGGYANEIENMVGGNSFTPVHACGEYFVLDKDQGNIVNSVIFQCPSKAGKGVLVTPTVHGNLLTGPDSFIVEDPSCVATKADLLEKVKEKALKSVPSIDFRKIIHEYAGVRPNTDIADFIIEESPQCKDFINLAGIRSPGLTSAPAIALECISILENCGLKTVKKVSFTDSRKQLIFRKMTDSQREALISEDSRYGRVICRCETVTEGEIVEALHRPIVPVSIDGIKRRCNAGMGRCQGGFCSPRIHEIIARELNIPYESVLMDEEGSFIISENTQEAKS